MTTARFRGHLTVAVIVLGAVLFLPGCQTGDVREEWVVACTSYTSVVEQLADNRALGVYTEEQWAEIQLIEARTTPLCLKPTTYNANSLILFGLRELNNYILMRGDFS